MAAGHCPRLFGLREYVQTSVQDEVEPFKT